MNYNKKILSAVILPVFGSIVFSGCISETNAIADFRKDLDYSFTQINDDSGFVGNTAFVSLGGNEWEEQYDPANGTIASVKFNDDTRIIDKYGPYLMDATWLNYGSTQFSDVQPQPGTLIYPLFEIDGQDVAMNLSAALPKIPVILSPTAGDIFYESSDDEILVQWEVTPDELVSSINFSTDCVYIGQYAISTFNPHHVVNLSGEDQLAGEYTISADALDTALKNHTEADRLWASNGIDLDHEVSDFPNLDLTCDLVIELHSTKTVDMVAEVSEFDNASLTVTQISKTLTQLILVEDTE